MVTLIVLIGTYYLFSNFFYLLLLYKSWALIDKKSKEAVIVPRHLPAVTALVSAKNEENYIINTVECLLHNPYPQLNIIIINDGSTDKTFEVLKNRLQLSFLERTVDCKIYFSKLHSQVWVIDKPNSGKADSLNKALQYVKTDYFFTIDADTYIDSQSIQLAMARLLQNDKCQVVGGAVRILNGSIRNEFKVLEGQLPSSHLAMFQVIEYIRSFFGGRIGFENLGGTALISGAFALYKKDIFIKSGGFDRNSITEDFESTINLLDYSAHKQIDSEIHMIPNPVCWTLAPEKIKDLFWQRVRWQKGLVQTLLKHKRLMFKPRLKHTGLLTLPYMLIFEAFSPIVEILSYFVIGIAWYQNLLTPLSVLIGVVLGVSYYSLLTFACINLEEKNYAHHDLKKPRIKFIMYAVAENFGYRQLLMFARIVGTVSVLQKNHHWGTHDRANDNQNQRAA